MADMVTTGSGATGAADLETGEGGLKASELVLQGVTQGPVAVASGCATRICCGETAHRVQLVISVLFCGGALLCIALMYFGILPANEIAYPACSVVAWQAGSAAGYNRAYLQLKGLDEQVDRLEGEVDALSDEVDRLAPINEELGAKLDRYEEQLARFDNLLNEYSDRQDAGLTRLEAGVGGLDRITQNFARMEEKFKGTADAMRAANAQRETQLAQTRAQIQERDRQIAETSEQNRKLKASVDAFSAGITDMDRLTEAQEELVARQQELQAREEALHEQRAALMTQLADQTTQQTALTKSLEEITARFDQGGKVCLKYCIQVLHLRMKLRLVSVVEEATRDGVAELFDAAIASATSSGGDVAGLRTLQAGVLGARAAAQKEQEAILDASLRETQMRMRQRRTARK